MDKHASSHIDRFASRCLFLYLLAKKITACIISAHRPIRQSMCDIGFVFSWSENSQHASSSHLDRFACRCAISGFVFSWPENHNMHHRTSTDAIRHSMCDIRFCISWPKNNMHHYRTGWACHTLANDLEKARPTICEST